MWLGQAGQGKRELGETLAARLLEEGWTTPEIVRQKLLDLVVEAGEEDWNKMRGPTQTAYRFLVAEPALTAENLQKLAETTLDIPPKPLERMITHPRADLEIWNRVARSSWSREPEDKLTNRQLAATSKRPAADIPGFHPNTYWILEKLADHPPAANTPLVAQTILQTDQRRLIQSLAQNTHDPEWLQFALQQLLEESIPQTVRWLQNECSENLYERIPSAIFQTLLSHDKDWIREAALRMTGQATPDQPSPSTRGQP